MMLCKFCGPTGADNDCNSAASGAIASPAVPALAAEACCCCKACICSISLCASSIKFSGKLSDLTNSVSNDALGTPNVCKSGID